MTRGSDWGTPSDEPTSAWPGNDTNRCLVARLWVGQHRQLRLAVANLAPEPAQGFVPLALPEFAGKTVHFDDLLADIAYDRPGDAGSRALRGPPGVRLPPV